MLSASLNKTFLSLTEITQEYCESPVSSMQRRTQAVVGSKEVMCVCVCARARVCVCVVVVVVVVVLVCLLLCFCVYYLFIIYF